MKKTNLISGLIVILLLVSLHAFAQDGREGKHDGNPDDKFNKKVESLTAEQRAENRAKKMQTDLTLTDEQYKSVYFLFLNNINRQDALKAAGTDKETMKSEMDKMKTETDAQLKTILTPEQYDKFKGKMKEGFKGKGKGRGKGNWKEH